MMAMSRHAANAAGMRGLAITSLVGYQRVVIGAVRALKAMKMMLSQPGGDVAPRTCCFAPSMNTVVT